VPLEYGYSFPLKVISAIKTVPLSNLALEEYIRLQGNLSVGKFHIADFDTYEPANINRQLGNFFGGVSGAAITVRYNKITEEIAGNKRLKRKAGKIKARIINI
jgi:hypothetical protein